MPLRTQIWVPGRGRWYVTTGWFGRSWCDQMSRLYFSHSYDPKDLRFNEHLWKLLMKAGFHAWIDTGRNVAPSPDSGQTGARRPMNISFNEWMMSQCDGFVAIVPKKRASPYQLLEYRTAVRMGVPRLVALPEGLDFAADEPEVISYPTSWNLFWQDDTQSKLDAGVKGFAERVRRYKTASGVLQNIGHWRPRQNSGRLVVALLPPRASDPAWQALQTLLQQKNDEVDWTLLSPANFRIEWELLKERFDVLVVDVGPSGSPKEALGYIHAIGVPLILLCRADSHNEVQDLGRFLDAGPGRRPRFVYEQNLPDDPAAVPIPRFLDGTKLDAKMQPIIFWTTAGEAADQVHDTADRILAFRSGLPQEEGGSAETMDTHQSAKKYFDQYWRRAQRGSVFISFAGQGAAAKLADRLAKILRFLDFRCFHYRDKDSNSDARLDSGEDVTKGLELRIDEADIVVYLIEEKFVESTFCQNELAQGRKLRDQGLVEFRAYSLDTPLPNFPAALQHKSVHNFRDTDWTHTDVEQRIVADVEQSAEVLGWALREKDRSTLADWLKQSELYSLDAVLKRLRQMGVPNSETNNIATAAAGEGWLDALLRLPEEPGPNMRARQIVALLLLAISYDNSTRAKTVERWLYERRLLQWPPLVAAENEDHVPIDSLVIDGAADRTLDEMKSVGQKLGQKHGDLLRSTDRPICVNARTDFLAEPVEWACESVDDEPLGVRRSVRWRLPEARVRDCIFNMIAKNTIPPTTLILSLANPDINPREQVRQLNDLLRAKYRDLGWPPELVSTFECQSVADALSRLRGCREHVVHIAGHMGSDGLQTGGKQVTARDLTGVLRASDVRLAVLNGCEGGKSASPVASSYLTLADRLIRDAGIPEVVAHRCKISETDALEFSKAFYASFFDTDDGFDTARSAVSGRKAGPPLLRYSPVVISQR